MNRADRKRQAKEDEKRLLRGIDAETRDPEPTAAMARQMHALLERATRERDIEPPVRYLHLKVEATLGEIRERRLACGKGCSHCCHAWVSATAPEVLFVAKTIKRRGLDAAAKIEAAHLATRDMDFRVRARNPQPCPMLDADVCTIYAARPNSCRFAASVDSGVCARALRYLSNENIPHPLSYMKARGAYEIAAVIALKHAGLPHHYYEFNAALSRALAHSDAERAWLSGEDVFADVQRDPNDALANPMVQQMYRHAFGQPIVL